MYDNVYIGVVGPELEPGIARDTIANIRRTPGDSMPIFLRGTKGFESRQQHINNFKVNEQFDGILLLDHDQTFPPDTLERLRSHGKPYISGLYMRRQDNPLAPVWFQPWKGSWPFRPWVGVPEQGRLHEIGASGWGCMLIAREVFDATAPILKGEMEIIEDDMDIWPYDLGKIMQALDKLSDWETLSINELNASVATLQQEIRPLRGVKDNVGSDLRFPFYALHAGYQMYGDPDVRCGHIINYELKPDDYHLLSEDAIKRIRNETTKIVNQEAKRVIEAVGELTHA